MASRPLVSIITPTFNHEAFIGACIESVIAQSYPHWELLIVNDGSDDDTGAVATGYASKDSRIRVFNRENIGVFRLGETYNHALSEAKGSIVGILEGDDLWAPNKLELQVAALENDPDAVLCWSRAMIVGDGLDITRTTDADMNHVPESWRKNNPVGCALNGLYLSNFIPAASILVRTDTIREIGGFLQREGLPLVDYPTLLDLATKGTFVFVDAVLAKWRWHPNQVTRLFHTDISERVRDTALEHHDRLEDALRPLITVTRREIHNRFRSEVHRAYVQSGRYKLVQRKYREARQDFVNALWYRGRLQPALRLQAVVGIGSSFFKTDLEWIARLLGKTDLSWKNGAGSVDSRQPTELSNS